MIIFGGVPDIFYSRFCELARDQMPSIEFTGVPLRSVKGRYEVDREYCLDLLNTVLAYLNGRPCALNYGLGVVLIRRTFETTDLREFFSPFALCVNLIIDQKLSSTGEGRKRAANMFSSQAISEGKKLSTLLRYLNGIFLSQVRRTPLLLPIRHFDSPDLNLLIDSVSTAVTNSDSPLDFVEKACEKFLRTHPRQLDGKGYVFENKSGVQFKTPSRTDFHGKRPASPNENGHKGACYLTSRLRLGGCYPDGFHYDCRKGANYSGVFRNCHDAEAFYKGTPHLNVFPNDYIR